MQSARL